MNTIFLDFDNTIVESNKKVIEILNDRYNLDKTEDDLKDYGYQSIYPISKEEVLEIYQSDKFFNNLEFKPGAKETILKYIQKFEIVITTKGTEENLLKKQKWINENLPKGIKVIGINNNSLSKKSVDMNFGFQIDDVTEALDTNAKVKILYKSNNNFPWQQNTESTDIIIVNDWSQIDDIISFYDEYDYNTLLSKSKEGE